MDLTKAMLRTGYYAPDHPGSQTAKTGLFGELQEALGDSKEIMLTNQETRERADILITGILDEPVSVRTVVGAGQAELFVPRLRDYFNKKGLVSFALKKEITEGHFDSFVDIMSDPKVDRGEGHEVGGVLTDALVKAGITDISTVFMDDMIRLEENLPWRVEMAIQRLAKDLKVVPMYHGKTKEEIQKMKLQIVQDIMRPLRHPELLKDIILNCYVIAKHVKDIEPEELEKAVIDTFPMTMILPTSRYIFEEMKKLQSKTDEHGDSAILKRRIQGVKRVLKLISKKVVLEEVAGAQAFLEQLYFNEILKFEELPVEVQYRVNTIKLADEIMKGPEEFMDALMSAKKGEEAMVILKSYHRAMPTLMEKGQWELVHKLSKSMVEASQRSIAFMGGEGVPAMPLMYVLHEYLKNITEGYEKCEKEDREHIDKILEMLGAPGIETLIHILGESKDKGVRKSAVEALMKMGPKVGKRMRAILDDNTQQWFVHRNALLIMSKIGEGEEDFDRAKRYLRHPKPRLREEALSALVKLTGRDAESYVLAALEDADPKVARRAVATLNSIQPVSESAVDAVLAAIKSPPPEDKSKHQDHWNKVAQMIWVFTGLSDFPKRDVVEDELIAFTNDNAKKAKGGFLKKIKRTFEEEDKPVALLAALDTLGKIGTEKSIETLEDITEHEGEVGAKAQEALNALRLKLKG